MRGYFGEFSGVLALKSSIAGTGAPRERSVIRRRASLAACGRPRAGQAGLWAAWWNLLKSKSGRTYSRRSQRYCRISPCCRDTHRSLMSFNYLTDKSGKKSMPMNKSHMCRSRLKSLLEFLITLIPTRAGRNTVIVLSSVAGTGVPRKRSVVRRWTGQTVGCGSRAGRASVGAGWGDY